VSTAQIARVVACIALAALAAPTASAAAPNDVPAPTVTGPISNATSRPFFSTDLDLASAGYIEEEYFLEGTARRYVNGLVTSITPYTTRIVVRRPLSTKKFNRVAVVEWYNVTAGYEQEYDWFASHEHLIREGYAWVGVSTQAAGILALKQFSLERYGSLNIIDDQLSEDIYSQAARSLHARSGPSPLGALSPRILIASGHSQSTVKLVGYYNTIQPQHGLFAGFLLRGSQTELRTDLRTKVMRVYSESDRGPEVMAASGHLDNAPDTDVYRRWDVAGTSHASAYEKEQGNYYQQRDRGSTTPADCLKPPFSQIPYHYAHNAAYDYLVRWAQGGAAPPIAPRFTTQPDGVTLARDERGFVIGGLRLPDLTVPKALDTGTNAGPGFCFLYGSHEPYDEGTLQQMYPTRADYVRKMDAAVVETHRAGFLLTADARDTCQRARSADFGWTGSAAELPKSLRSCPV
jgi:alpha/beta hydrolase family protein